MVAQRPGPQIEGIAGYRAPLERSSLAALPPVAATRLSAAVGGRRRAGTAPSPTRPRPDVSEDSDAGHAHDSKAAAIQESQISRKWHGALPTIEKQLTSWGRQCRSRFDKLASPR